MKKLILTLFLSIPLLTGCWNAKEISELSIATGLGIDKNGDNGYLISIQLINPGEVTVQKGSGRSEVTTYQIKAPTIYEALRKLTVELPRRIYLSHVQIIILGEDIAKDGIKESVDFLSRDHEFRSDFYLLIAKKAKAEDILSVLTPMQKVPALSMYSQLEMSEKLWAPTVITNLDELVSDMISLGKDPIVTGIVTTGNLEEAGSKTGTEKIRPAGNVRLKGVAIFRGDKLVGWLNQNETKGLNYLTSNVKSTVGHLKCPDGGKFVAEVTSAKSKLTSQIKNGRPKIIADMYIEENVGEVQCSLDLSKEKTIKQMEKIVEERIVKLSKDSVGKAQKLESDIFGFGEVIHRQHPKEWKKMKSKWTKEIFPELEVEYRVKVDIRRIGTITNSVYDQVKE